MFILNLIDIMKILNMQRSILSTKTKTVINKWLFKKKKKNLSTENLRMISGQLEALKVPDEQLLKSTVLKVVF